nr:hypothetical protein [Kosakonia oryziphila]
MLEALESEGILVNIARGSTAETRQAMADLTINNLVGYFNDGKLLTPVVWFFIG